VVIIILQSRLGASLPACKARDCMMLVLIGMVGVFFLSVFYSR